MDTLVALAFHLRNQEVIMKYNQLYNSAQPSVFSHILLNDVVNTCLFLSNDINCLLCALVVAESCLLSLDKKSEILHAVDAKV